MSTGSIAPAGWHPDPSGRHDHRYWDGTTWTEHVADGGRRGIDWQDLPPRPGGASPLPPPPPGADDAEEIWGESADLPSGGEFEDQFGVPRRGPSLILLVLATLLALALLGAAGYLGYQWLRNDEEPEGAGTFTGRVESGLGPDVYRVEVPEGDNLVLTLRPAPELDASLAVAVDEQLLVRYAERLSAEQAADPDAVLAELQEGFDPVLDGFVVVFADDGGPGEEERIDTAGSEGAGLEQGTYLVAVQAFGGTAGDYELEIAVIGDA